MIQEYQLRVLPEVAANEQQLKEYLVQEKGLNVRNINATRILKRSIDARQRTIFVNLNVRVYLNEMPKDDEYQPTIYKNVEDKPQVIVVGAGPGGMMAAWTAAKRGHQVILCEKGNELGGAIRFADHVYFKRDMAYWRHQMENRLADSNVDVRLNTAVDADYVNQIRPDVLIIAVGADPARPPIPGLSNPKVIVGATMHYAPQNYGDKVVVIGGGLIGCESAAELHADGRDVTVVEMLPGIALGCGQAQSNALRVGMIGVKVMTSTACKRITDEGVWVQTEGQEEQLLPADSVILSAGMRPRTSIVEELQKAVVPETYTIGDCAAARKMGDAIREGYYTAMNL